MPIISVYVSELLFQRLEKARVGKSRSSFIVSVLAEKLGAIEASAQAESGEKTVQDDPLKTLHEWETRLKELEAAKENPKDNHIVREIAESTLKYGRRRSGLGDLPQDHTAWNEEQKQRFWAAVARKLDDKIQRAENMIEEHRLDGIRHERCMKLVGMSLNKLREIHKELGCDFQGPTIREFASAIGVTYQKAANIAPLLGREYGFITEKERREIEKEEAEE